MQKKFLYIGSLFLVLLFTSGTVFASEEDESKEKQQVFGWQLMTSEERAEHRQRMRSFSTAEERDEYRREHHKKMEERAKAEGVELPKLPRGMATLD